MERFNLDAIELTWEPRSRIALLRFTHDTRGTGREANALVQTMRLWIGDASRPFALLGDGRNLSSVDAEYRSIWGKFFREHRENCCVAFFNMGPVVRVAAEMFRIGTGLRMKAFARESDARSWLRERGIRA